MAIAKSADGQAAANTISLSSTGIAAGDLVIVHAYRSGSTTVPSSPGANWTDILTSSGANTNSRRIGYRIIQAGDNLATIVGTWTNATAIQFIGLTGYNATTKIGATGTGGSNTTTLTTPAVSLTDASGNSWVVAFAGSKATNANSVTLSSTTNEVSSQGALNLATGRNISSYASRAYSATVNASANRMDAVEVFASIPVSSLPTVLALTFSGATPTVSTPVVSLPTALALTFSGATPVVAVTNDVTAEPTVLAMTLTGAVPDVSTPVVTVPGAFALVLTGAVPDVATPLVIAPAALALAFAGAVPDVQVSSGSSVEALPTPLELVLTGAVPNVAVTDNILVEPAVLALALAFATPTVSGGTVVRRQGGDSAPLLARVYRRPIVDLTEDEEGLIVALIT